MSKMTVGEIQSHLVNLIQEPPYNVFFFLDACTLNVHTHQRISTPGNKSTMKNECSHLKQEWDKCLNFQDLSGLLHQDVIKLPRSKQVQLSNAA